MPSLPSTEERLKIVRGSDTTWFATESDWPFHIPDISPLWDGEDVELVNREIAGGDEATYPPVGVPSRRAVTVQVFGAFDLNGDEVAPASQRTQLETNISHLMTKVVARVTTGDGLAVATLYGVGGVSKGDSDVQFVGPLRTQKGDTPAEAIVTLDMYFPHGVFAL